MGEGLPRCREPPWQPHREAGDITKGLGGLAPTGGSEGRPCQARDWEVATPLGSIHMRSCVHESQHLPQLQPHHQVGVGVPICSEPHHRWL